MAYRVIHSPDSNRMPRALGRGLLRGVLFLFIFDNIYYIYHNIDMTMDERETSGQETLHREQERYIEQTFPTGTVTHDRVK